MHPEIEFLPWQPLLYFGSLVALLAVSLKLRKRLGLPVLLPLGVAIAALGYLLELAIGVLGIEAVWEALEPMLRIKSDENVVWYDDQEVTMGFLVLLWVMQVIRVLGLFLGALGLLHFARQRVARAVEATTRLHSPPTS